MGSSTRWYPTLTILLQCQASSNVSFNFRSSTASAIGVHAMSTVERPDLCCLLWSETDKALMACIVRGGLALNRHCRGAEMVRLYCKVNMDPYGKDEEVIT